MSQHVISQDDCLSLIAERYNVTVDELLLMNPDIIDPNLIYTGDTLTITEPLDNSRLTSIPLPQLPAITGTTCGKEYADVVYFPDKGEWWAITKELQQRYLEEAELMADSVDKLHEPGHEDAVKEKMDRLGLLQGFKNLAHHTFLNHEDAIKYKSLKLLHQQYDHELKIKGESFIDKKTKETLAKLRLPTPDPETIEKIKGTHRIGPTHQRSYIPEAKIIAKLEIEEILEKHERNLKKKISATLKKITPLKERALKNIEEYNKKIELNEKDNKLKIAIIRDRSDFLFSSRAKEIEKLANHYIEQTSSERSPLKNSYRSKPDDVKHIFWQEYMERRLEQKNIPKGFGRVFFDTVAKLNSYGIAVKEQLLTLQELIGHDTLIPGFKGRLDSSDLEEEVYDVLMNAAQQSNQLVGECLSYYQALKLRRRCEEAIQKKTSELLDILATAPQPGMFFRLSILLMAAEQRLSSLENLAMTRVKMGPNSTPGKGIAYLPPEYKEYTVWRLLLNNIHEFTANPLQIQDLSEQIKEFNYHLPDTEPADKLVKRVIVSPVECYLNSNKGKASFIRESEICNEKALASCHAIKLHESTKASFNSYETGNLYEAENEGIKKFKNDIKKQISDIKKTSLTDVGIKIKDISIDKEWVNTTGEKLHKNLYQAFNVNGQHYNVDLDAQYFRFTMSSKFDAGMEVDGKRGKAKLGGELLNVKYDLFNAQVSSQFQFPDSEGIELKWNHNIAQMKNEIHCGWFRLDINAVFGGYIGANAMMAANLQLISKEGSLAVNGLGSISPETAQSYNPDSRMQSVDPDDFKQVKDSSGLHAQGGFFAGIQLGGEIKADLLWKDNEAKDLIARLKNSSNHRLPHKEENTHSLNSCSTDVQYQLIQKLIEASLPISSSGWVKLCGSSAAVSLSAGIGLQGQFLLSIKGGRLVFICSAKVSKGIGGSVKLGFYLDAGNMELLLYKILKALAETDYRKVNFFDKNYDGDVFDYVSDVLTLGLFLRIHPYALTYVKRRDLFKNTINYIFDNRAEYTDSVACYILNLEPVTHRPLPNCQQDDRQVWFDNLMPEVRGRLIFLLLADSDESRLNRKYNMEAVQREAILKIFEWHTDIQSAVSRQYLETLERINRKGEKSKHKDKDKDSKEERTDIKNDKVEKMNADATKGYLSVMSFFSKAELKDSEPYKIDGFKTLNHTKQRERLINLKNKLLSNKG